MTASLRLRYLAGSVLALSLVCGLAPSAADAAGSPNFTISVSMSLDGWGIGDFTSSGAISDIGNVDFLSWYEDRDGLIWYRCRFVGVLGSFEAALPAFPERGAKYPFELTNATGEYEGLYATGTTKGTVRETFFWYDDDQTVTKWKWYYVEYSWAITGFLSP